MSKLDVQNDIAELRAAITTTESDQAAKRAAAEKLMKERKAAMPDLLTNTSDEAKASYAEIDQAYKASDELGQRAAELRARLHRQLDDIGQTALEASDGDPSHPTVRSARNLGALVTASESYAALLASNQLAQADDRSPVRFDPVEVLSYKQAARFLATGMVHLADAGDGGTLVPLDQQLDPVMLPKRMPTVLDMIRVQPTRREVVRWARQTTRTNNAATTAFGTALPKNRYLWETVDTSMKRVGAHAVVDEGNITDSDEFEGTVNGELTSDLRLTVEGKVLSAAGGADMTGLNNTAGISTFDATDETLADAYHKALTTLRIALEAEPTAFGVSPLDFEAVYLEKGTDGHYLHHRGTLEGGPQTIWGKPAMVSTVFTTPAIADWQRAATLYVNEGISISVGRIDDQFIEGLFTIRAQTRLGLAVKQPKAYCRITNLGVVTP